MRDYLLDLVQHTHDLGCIDLVKITGTDATTAINGLAEDKSVVVEAQFHNPVPAFIGTFGMPNLSKLKILLNLQEYREKATITLTKKATGELDGLNFDNASGDFTNSYRFMTTTVVNEKLKTLTFNTPTWHVEFAPTAAAIQKLRMQAQANAEHNHPHGDHGSMKH